MLGNEVSEGDKVTARWDGERQEDRARAPGSAGEASAREDRAEARPLRHKRLTAEAGGGGLSARTAQPLTGPPRGKAGEQRSA